MAKVVSCTDQRVTVLGVGKLDDNEGQEFLLPLPPSLSAVLSLAAGNKFGDDARLPEGVSVDELRWYLRDLENRLSEIAFSLAR